MSVVDHLEFHVLKSGPATTINGELPTGLEVGQTGFHAGPWSDRSLLFVQLAEKSDGESMSAVPVTQRGWDDPAINTAVRHEGDSILARIKTDIQSGHIELSAPDGSRLQIDDEPIDGQLFTVRIFGKLLAARDQGEDAAAFGAHVFGRPVRLVRADETSPRMLPPSYQRKGAANEAAGHDSQPLTLLNMPTLRYLLEQSGLPPDAVPPGQYRMNITIDGPDIKPRAEELSRRWQIGPVDAFAVNSVMRCIMTTIGQEDGERGTYPGLRALRPTLGRNNHGELGVFLGVSLNPIVQADGKIAIGDQVVITEMADQPFYTPGKS